MTVQAIRHPVLQRQWGKWGQQGILYLLPGKSVFDAARNVTFGLHLRNYWPHTQAVIIGEEFEILLSVVDFTETPRRLSVYFLVGKVWVKTF